MDSKVLRSDAINGLMVSLVTGVVLIGLLAEGSGTAFTATWTATKLLWAVMTTGFLVVSAAAGAVALSSVRAMAR